MNVVTDKYTLMVKYLDGRVIRMDTPERMQLITDHLRSWRKVAQLTVLWTDVIAAVQGVHPTDLIAASHLHEAGPTTAGRLAQVVGLSTGAMTACIDRLEKAGIAKRDADSSDRRKVIIKPGKLPRLSRELSILQARSMKKAESVFEQYSDAQIGRMTECMLALAEIFAEEASEFRASHRQSLKRKKRVSDGRG
ncbi:MAG: MarR family winged helix-turn-helix transcriptional regulator [Steroidobacteraceae bacterium]